MAAPPGFRGLLLRERAARAARGRWWALAVDVVGGGGEWLTQCDTRSEACARQAKALVATRSKDLGGAAVTYARREGGKIKQYLQIGNATIPVLYPFRLEYKELEARLHMRIYWRWDMNNAARLNVGIPSLKMINILFPLLSEFSTRRTRSSRIIHVVFDKGSFELF